MIVIQVIGITALVWLTIGLLCMIGYIVQLIHFKIKIDKPLLAPAGLVFLAIFWPLTLASFYQTNKAYTHVCAACGEIFDGEQGLLDHIRVCERHPMREEINRVMAERQKAIDLAERSIATADALADKNICLKAQAAEYARLKLLLELTGFSVNENFREGIPALHKRGYSPCDYVPHQDKWRERIKALEGGEQ